MRYRTIVLLALTIFCGIGAGVFLMLYENSLLGTFLSVLYPFVASLSFFSLGYDALHKLKGKETPAYYSNKPVKMVKHYHHPKTA